MAELKAALRGPARTRAPIAVQIRRVGFFPNPHSPRIFWCGIEAPGLAELAADTDAATAALGIAREKRPYSPHLTLARIKERVELQPLRKAIAGLAIARVRQLPGGQLLSVPEHACGHRFRVH